MSIRDDQLIFRYFECKEKYKKDFSKDLVKRFANIRDFCNGDINKFIFYQEKEFFLTNTWIAEKDLMKHHYLTKNNFTAV